MISSDRWVNALQVWMCGQCVRDAIDPSETDSCSESPAASGTRSAWGARRAGTPWGTPAFCGTANFTASGTTKSEFCVFSIFYSRSDEVQRGGKVLIQFEAGWIGPHFGYKMGWSSCEDFLFVWKQKRFESSHFFSSYGRVKVKWADIKPHNFLHKTVWILS